MQAWKLSRLCLPRGVGDRSLSWGEKWSIVLLREESDETLWQEIYKNVQSGKISLSSGQLWATYSLTLGLHFVT